VTQPGKEGSAQRLTFGRIMAVAVVTGLTLGALFAIRETFHASELFHKSFRADLANLLAMALHAMARYCPAGCVLALLVAVGTWAVARVHGYRLNDAWVAALCGAGLLLVVLPSVMWLGRPIGSGAREYVKSYLAPEIAVVTLFCSVGFGCAAYAASRWAGATARLAAAAAGLVAALLVLTLWGLWLGQLEAGKRFGLIGKLSRPILFALAVALGVGLYRLALGLLRRRGPRDTRRAVQGAAIVFASLALLLGGSWAVALPRPRWTPAAAPDSRPNVVWLILDTARADAFSCYGNPRKTSPCLDKLAAEGALFERAYSQSSWTRPSHASMFTGLLPSGVGTTTEQGMLWDERTTVAEVLAEHGYATFACSSNLNVCGLTNLDQGFQRFHVLPWGRGPETPWLLTHALKGLHRTDNGSAAMNRVATRWIDEARQAGRPFFLFINYFEVHHVYGNTPGFRRWLPPGVGASRALRIPQNPEKYAAGAVSASSRDFEVLRALYEGDLTYLDERVGELAEHLRRLGTLDNTLLIVTSDHGEELGEHKRIEHRFGLRDTLLHVPLIIRYPGRFQAGTRRGDIVELTDLFPTILDVVGLAWDGREKLHGRSLLAPPRPEAEQFAVAQRDLSLGWLTRMAAHYPWWDILPYLRRQMAIQGQRFKYLWSSDDTAELFDLSQDPLENHNVLDRFPEEAARLRAALEARLGLKLRAGLSAAGIAKAADAGAPHRVDGVLRPTDSSQPADDMEALP